MKILLVEDDRNFGQVLKAELADAGEIDLAPDGYLLVGHAESLHGWNMNFQFLHDNKGTAYKRIDPCGPPV